MKKYIIILISCLILGLLVITCPNASQHKQEITRAFVNYANSKIGYDFENHPIISFLGGTFIDIFFENFVDQHISVDNYFVFSVGNATYEGKCKAVSFGILGHVFTFDEKDIDKEIGDSFGGSDTE